MLIVDRRAAPAPAAAPPSPLRRFLGLPPAARASPTRATLCAVVDDDTSRAQTPPSRAAGAGLPPSIVSPRPHAAPGAPLAAPLVAPATALALLLATALALVAVDAASVPWASLARAHSIALPLGQTLSLLLRSLVYRFGDLLALQFVVVLLLLGRQRGASKGLLLAAALAVAVCVAGSAHLTLVTYPKFRGYPPFVVAAACLFAFSAASSTLLLTSVGGRWMRRLVGASGLVGAALALGFHLTRFKNLYPSLHQSLFAGALVLASAGAWTFASAYRPRRPDRPQAASRTPRRFAVALSALTVALFALERALPLPSPFVAHVAATTLLGTPQGFALMGGRGEGRESAAVEVPCVTSPLESHAGPRGALDDEALFRRVAAVPSLRDDFRLSEHNVLLINVEATRFDKTSLGNPRLGTTPFLAELERRGAFIFPRAYAPSCRTLASMGSAFTMTFPSHVPMTVEESDWCGEIAPRTDTVAEAFSRSGYHTFHAVHVGGPEDRCVRGLSQGFAARTFEPAPEDKADVVMGVDERVTAHAEAAFESAARSGKRFFGWLFYVSPHHPYRPRKPGTPQGSLAAHLENIEHVDGQLARVFAALERTGLAKNTVVVFYADHGEEFGEHGGAVHGTTVYEEQVHVPLVVWIPGERGRRIDAPTSTLYALPWLMLHGPSPLRDAALARVSSDLAPMMRATDESVVIERIGTTRMLVSLVKGPLKFDYDLNSRLAELYDLSNDPTETFTLFDTDRARAQPFLTRLDAYRAARACRRAYRLPP